ncbi:MAG: glycosyltransferase family 2 protein [Acidobacteria bacterium]|jgi:glycosyltransferase involved in cell wall biosynthesis|nr:glycosyltransferase family 2 protein [Acidobacteriota bacterium]
MNSVEISKVSIALCTYNGESFLSEQLESFIRQTRLPDELVIGDDCSNDKTVKIIEDFAKAAPFPVRLKINEKNSGSTKNFEQTILRCTGDLIFLSDQDDIWLPEKLEKIAAEFEKSDKIGLVFSDAALVGENLEPLGYNLWNFSFTIKEQRKAKKQKMLEVLIDRNVVTGATMAFRAWFRELFSPIPTDIPFTIHDAWIALVIAANADVAVIKQPLIKYRQHSNQQLGINLQFKRKLKQQTRQEKYEESICFQIKDLERLAKLAEIIQKYPQLERKEKKLSITQLIKISMLTRYQKIQHYEARKNISSEKLKRIVLIWRELKTGRYHRYSRGLISVAIDLLEN